MRRGIGLLLLSAALLGGCSTGGDDPDPDEAPASPAAAPPAAPLDMDLAVEAFCAEVAAREWPASIPVTSEQPPRPYVRITTIHDRTPETFDVGGLLNELENGIYARGALWLVAESSGLDELHTERDYSGSSRSAGAGRRPEAGLELTGEITGSAAAGFEFRLELRDVRTGKVEVETRTSFGAARAGG